MNCWKTFTYIQVSRS